MAEEPFLRELETRLEENRRVAAGSRLPEPLHGLASYLGFHHFRTVLLLSLGLTILTFGWFYPQMIHVSKLLFGYR